MWRIEDEAHAELHGECDSFESALAELRRRALIPWDVAPNVAPCTSWKTCGRVYEVVEFDAQSPSRTLQRIPVMNISASGVQWMESFGSAE